ncbi:MAG TPA: ROK family protein [Bacteroidales bacterium]|nr:ROK family protein [Bacteroidales bacterium]
MVMCAKEVAVGIDIGGTNSVFGFVDIEGNILGEGRIKTTEYIEIEAFIEALYNKIQTESCKTSNKLKIIGYGIGAPMGNINKGTIEHAAGLPWKGIVPIAGIFQKYSRSPVIVTNDANAAAIGEMIYGGAREMKDFVVITLGTGFGSGIVTNGRLVYGHDGFAGEIGHTALSSGYSDRECGCGRKGCLETYVSAPGLKRTLMKLISDTNEPSGLRDYSFNELISEMICDAAKRGDKLAKMAFHITGKILGIKLAEVVAYTNPEAIFLFGGLTNAKELIFDPAKEYMEENMLSIYKGKVRLLASELNTQNAAVLGASSLVWLDKKYN